MKKISLLLVVLMILSFLTNSIYAKGGEYCAVRINSNEISSSRDLGMSYDELRSVIRHNSVQLDNSTGYRSASGVAITGYIAGLGSFAITALGVVTICGIIVTSVVIADMIRDRVSFVSTKDKKERAIKKIPNELFVDGNSDTEQIDLGQFKKGKKGTKVHSGRKEWTLEKDHGNHWGKNGFKLNKNGKRVATLDSDGYVVSD